jgi:hypothetical protein
MLWTIVVTVVVWLLGLVSSAALFQWMDGALPPPRFKPVCVAFAAHSSSATTAQ